MALRDSLQKMRVPSSDGGSDLGVLMPKLQYRFRVLFEKFAGVSATELTKQVIDVSRPNVSFPEIPLEMYNSRMYIAGKPTWEPVSLNVRDDVTGAVANLVGNQLQRQFDFQEQASAAAGNDYKFTMKIQILDGGNGASEPGVVEEFSLFGCYIASANYNTLNYATNEAVTVSLSIRYDNALQSKSGSDSDAFGIGQELVARQGQLGTNVS
jgi:hypothetical protein